jgi:hypothetical protein
MQNIAHPNDSSETGDKVIPLYNSQFFFSLLQACNFI